VKDQSAQAKTCLEPQFPTRCAARWVKLALNGNELSPREWHVNVHRYRKLLCIRASTISDLEGTYTDYQPCVHRYKGGKRVQRQDNWINPAPPSSPQARLPGSGRTTSPYIKSLGWGWFYLSTRPRTITAATSSHCPDSVTAPGQCPERDGSLAPTCGLKTCADTLDLGTCQASVAIRFTSFINLDCLSPSVHVTMHWEGNGTTGPSYVSGGLWPNGYRAKGICTRVAQTVSSPKPRQGFPSRNMLRNTLTGSERWHQTLKNRILLEKTTSCRCRSLKPD